MERLIERGLMFGNLIEVATETLRDRYNAGLEALTGKRTALDRFHIDLSGYSPEIGDELGDHDYFNPNGCNRMFVLLTVEQETRPLIGARFSSSRSILRRFIADNRAELFALTARDAVIGELENSTYRMGSLRDALSIRRIRVAVETPKGLITSAIELQRRIDELERSPTACGDELEQSPPAWSDDGKLEAVIDLARRVGDIRRNPLVPRVVEYEQGNFHTTHFGGLYAFRDVPYPALIACDPEFVHDGTIDIDQIGIGDTAPLRDFLSRNGLIQHVAGARDLDDAALLRQRLDFILIDHLSGLEDGPDLDDIRPGDLRRMVHRYYDDLPGEFRLIVSTLQAIEQGVEPPSIEADDPGYFYLVRSSMHADRDLVNHLLARLTPLDFRQHFICNKDFFYETYRGWGARKRGFVAEFLARHYTPAKAEAKAALFGASPAIEADEPARARAGPWGPIPTES